MHKTQRNGCIHPANKAGLDVLDFRDGESREYFSHRSVGINMAELVGVKYRYHVSGVELLRECEIGKEYIIRIGGHASVVRRTDKGKFEYLELQSPDSNGWKHLDARVFEWRFGARGRTNASIVDIDLLTADAGFQKVMGYINTAPDKQRKSKRGTIK